MPAAPWLPPAWLPAGPGCPGGGSAVRGEPRPAPGPRLRALGLGRGRGVASPAWLRCQLPRRALPHRLKLLLGACAPRAPPGALGVPAAHCRLPRRGAGKEGKGGRFPALSPESVSYSCQPSPAFLLICVHFAKTMANCEAVGMGTITILTMI